MLRNLFFIISVFVIYVSHGHAVEMFGGLTQFLEYKSSIPCEAQNNDSCSANSGLLGFALDKASDAGLNISKISQSKDQQIMVATEDYGVCKVETKNLKQVGTLGFLCASNGTLEKPMEKIDRVLSLAKEEKDYSLVDITDDAKMKGQSL